MLSFRETSYRVKRHRHYFMKLHLCVTLTCNSWWSRAGVDANSSLPVTNANKLSLTFPYLLETFDKTPILEFFHLPCFLSFKQANPGNPETAAIPPLSHNAYLLVGRDPGATGVITAQEWMWSTCGRAAIWSQDGVERSQFQEAVRFQCFQRARPSMHQNLTNFTKHLNLM